VPVPPRITNAADASAALRVRIMFAFLPWS
jgi:hypothetical protein